jgi:hypothetical protein
VIRHYQLTLSKSNTSFKKSANNYINVLLCLLFEKKCHSKTQTTSYSYRVGW